MIAFFQDLTVDDPLDLVSPAFLALDLRLQRAREVGRTNVPRLAPFDMQGRADLAVTAAQEVADDPTYVAAVAAPFWTPPAEALRILQAARVPVFDLSGAGPPVGAIVSGLYGQGAFLARSGILARGARICVTGDGTGMAAPFAEAFIADPRSPPTETIEAGAADDVTAAVARLGCDHVVWAGGTTGAIALRLALDRGGMRGVGLAGSQAIRTDAYLSGAGVAADGTLATDGCAQVELSVSPRAQAFVNAYQAGTGLAPGPCAAEGWEVAGMVLNAMAGGATDPRAMAASLADLAGPGEVGGGFRFDPRAAMLTPRGHPALSVASGSRWIPLG
jgi:hypothetical protein